MFYEQDAPSLKELRQINNNWDQILLVLFGEEGLKHVDNLGRLLVLRQKAIYVGYGSDYATFMSERSQDLYQLSLYEKHLPFVKKRKSKPLRTDESMRVSVRDEMARLNSH